jgi:ATP-dependent Lon protease
MSDKTSHPAVPTVATLRSLPLVPLRGNVPLPGLPVPLSVGRPGTRAAIEAALALPQGEQEVLLLMQRHPEVESPVESDLHRVGVIARLLQVVPQPGGDGITAVVHATQRAVLARIVPAGDFLYADVEIAPQQAGKADVETDALVGTIRSLVRQISTVSPTSTNELVSLSARVDDPGALADLVAGALPFPRDDRQQILEAFDPKERLRLVSRLVGRSIEVAELAKKIETEVHGQLEEHKRQAILREQMRAIRKELGDEEDSEVQDLRKKLDEADLSPEAKTVADRELKRLESMGAGSPERGYVVNYLEWLAALPWTKTSQERSDLLEARRVIDREHFGMDKAKERILESLAVRKLRPDGRAPILCFVGPPGVGKTSLAQAVAEATGRELVRISVGGVSDESEIRGHRRTYVGALPGRILAALRKAGTRNPVFVVDEIDKMAASFHGDPAAALLEVLDPEQNKDFVDRYVEVPFDLSRVLFITTANTLDTLARPLLDRMEVIEIAGYTEAEKLEIARRHLWRRVTRDAGLAGDRFTITDEAVRAVIDGYTREAGVRSLERKLSSIARKLALEVASGKEAENLIDEDDLPRLLGPRRLFRDALERLARPGVVMGLAWTPVGGEVLFVEAARIPGSGKLQLTGSLGEVMKESAHAALTWIRSQPDLFPRASEFDFHVHVPAGAVPKDGPSAGVAMLSALASIVTGRRARHDVAMTGEITLRGQVLPVGGIRDKVLAAARAGATRVVIPKRNAVDLDDVPADVRASLEFVLVDSADEVTDAVLEPRECGSGVLPR